MITAALNAAFRDVENFVDLVVMVATWLSPVIYRITLVEEAIGGTVLYWLYVLNPLTIVVELDRKSTRLNSSHVAISYAVFCLKKKKTRTHRTASGAH